MSRYGVTFTDIATAADELKEEGIEPTIEKIHNLLGTSSNSTIGKYLQEWRLHDASVQAVISKTSTPDSLRLAVDKVWQQVSEQAQQEIGKMREALGAKLAMAEEAYQTLLQEQDQLQTRYREAT